MDITFKNVSYTYQPNTPFSHQALEDLSFHIPKGSYVAIIGHTGSGKSTLIQHLNGLVRPTKGEVNIGSYRLTNEERPKDMKQLRSEVGVVFQYPEHQLFEETVKDDISFGPRNFSVPEAEINDRIEKVIPEVGLTNDFLQRSPFDLSGGQMRRVAIAGVLAVRPRVLVLDEPTAGLDPQGQNEMMQMFYHLHQQQDLTTILVTHNMEDALTYADHVIILNQGKLYMEGKPEELFTKKDALQKVHLDVPDVIYFLQQFENKFGEQIKYEHQSIAQIATAVQRVIKGDAVL